MKALDKEMAKSFVSKLSQIPEDQKPLWGRMNRDQLYGHLALVVRYTMGETPSLPYRGKWVYRNIFRHLIVNGLVEFPRNVRLPKPKGADKDIEPPTCAIEDLERALDEYLAAAEKGTLKPQLHPFFGTLSAREWQKFHVGHFKHHMKQFNVW